MARRRENNIFTLSFIDVMAGGFGAVVIMFLIINHATESTVEVDNRNLRAESRLLDYQLTSNEENLSFLRDLVGNLSIRIADVKRLIDSTITDLDIKEEELEDIEKTSVDQAKTLEELLQDFETTRREVEALSRAARNQEGQTTVEFEGDGQRQYLTGMYMGGNHILIALDASASMLDSSIVNVLRRRNMAIERQLAAPKWQRAIRTVEWLTANVPLESRFQLVLFNNKTTFLMKRHSWIDASDAATVRALLNQLQNEVPRDGTNLKGLFELTANLHPLPDNIFLIVDSLPTMNAETTDRATISPRDRIRYFYDAIATLPAGIPVNAILFPLEGDPLTPVSFWNLAYATGGTMMSPSDDWP